jgi:hypothetical protein
MYRIRNVARAENIIVIVSIHVTGIEAAEAEEKEEKEEKEESEELAAGTGGVGGDVRSLAGRGL